MKVSCDCQQAGTASNWLVIILKQDKAPKVFHGKFETSRSQVILFEGSNMWKGSGYVGSSFLLQGSADECFTGVKGNAHVG